MKTFELFIAGLVLSAASETRFDIFVRFYDANVVRAWESAAHAAQWAFQQHGWGDFNRYEDD